MGEDASVLNAAARDHLQALDPLPAAVALTDHKHFVQFYEDEVSLLDSVTRYVSQGLRAGDACVVIGTAGHRNELATRLGAHGLDVLNDGLADQYFAFDALETLSTFCVDGQ